MDATIKSKAKALTVAASFELRNRVFCQNPVSPTMVYNSPDSDFLMKAQTEECQQAINQVKRTYDFSFMPPRQF